MTGNPATVPHIKFLNGQAIRLLSGETTVILKHFFRVHERKEDIKMVLNPCYMVIDRDGDIVDACNARLPPSTLDHVLERVNRTHPENSPFRIVKWDGYGFVEVMPVS